ncbi:MAG: AIPR family protein [Oscillospiraceae bacterium]|jgi:hypothetical protein|nr:AIPR family protein [Oscillospiraceae bacterium]
MNIAKQLVDNRVDNIVEENPEFFSDIADVERKKSKAFLLLAVASYLEIEVSDALQYITDGGADGGFDAAFIAEAEDSQLTVILFQTKYTRDLSKDANYPENAIVKAINAISCVFDPNKHIDLNENSKTVLTDIRSYLLDGYIPFVTFVCINNGIKWDNSAQQHIDNNFGTQKQVVFDYYNHENIIARTMKIKGINASLQLKGKSIREDFNYKSVILGRLSVKEVHRLMKEEGDKLLEKNIRKFLGRNLVNEGIRNTLLQEDNRNNFFFFNNGITIVCEKFSANYLQDKDWILKADNIQIINGGQTCKTIFHTLEDNPDIDFTDVDVLVRIYEVSSDENVVQDITLATNSQNPVDFRDLKSNSEEQLLLEQGATQLGYVYKRKRDSQINQIWSEIIPSSVAAESVLAIWRNRPHLAKHKKNEFFNNYYDIIFKDLNAAQMILAVLIFRYCDNNRRKLSANSEVQATRKYSQYLLSMIIGSKLMMQFNLKFDQLSHKNFKEVKEFFEEHKEKLYADCENYLIGRLHDSLSFIGHSLKDMDGRTIAAAFRRHEIVEQCLNNINLL